MVGIAAVTTEVMADREQINLIVRVTDADGAVGEGESWWGIRDRTSPERAVRPIQSVVDDVLAPRLVGRDADAIERLWFEEWDWGFRYGDQGIFAMALSGIDLALWDLKGKRLGIPVHALLGGPVFDTIPAYASLPGLRDPSLLVRETGRAIDAGFTAVKLHEVDPALTWLLRSEFEDTVKLMVDVNGHFDPIEAIAHGRRLTELGVTWFEEPVRPMRDHRALARVAAAVGCDLAAGENEYTLADFERLLATGAIAYLQPEITKIGGLTPARKVAALAELHNVALSPHNFRLGPALYASIQWGFTSAATRWIEVPWLPEDVRFSHRAVLPELHDGKIHPPSGPGLGTATE